MAKRLIWLLIFPLTLFGGNLNIENGSINAHTEVFGDSAIEPSVNTIFTDLNINGDDLESIKGIISFKIMDFVSSNSDRDEHMQEMFEMEKYPDISFVISKVSKQDANYMLEGIMDIHGVKKPLQIPVAIEQNQNRVTMYSNFSVKVTDYGMEPPSLLFFTVRDQVDVNATLNLKLN
jgi:polyisoprenoid-binding protein YceI